MRCLWVCEKNLLHQIPSATCRSVLQAPPSMERTITSVSCSIFESTTFSQFTNASRSIDWSYSRSTVAFTFCFLQLLVSSNHVLQGKLANPMTPLCELTSPRRMHAGVSDQSSSCARPTLLIFLCGDTSSNLCASRWSFRAPGSNRMMLKETLVIDNKSSTDGRFLLSQNRSHCQVRAASPVSNWNALRNQRSRVSNGDAGFRGCWTRDLDRLSDILSVLANFPIAFAKSRACHRSTVATA